MALRVRVRVRVRVEVGRLVDAVDQQDERAHLVELEQHRVRLRGDSTLARLGGKVELQQPRRRHRAALAPIGRRAGRGVPAHLPGELLHVDDAGREHVPRGVLRDGACQVRATLRRAVQQHLGRG